VSDSKRQSITVPQRPIPSTGERIPVIGLGTWQTFDVGPSAYEDRGQVLADFVSLGGTLVDSSPMYGRAEEAIGALARRLGLASRLFIATKVWTSGRATGIIQMESSLDKLGIDHLDLLQVHNLIDVETHLRTLREWKLGGRVRYIGITHSMASAHAAVAKVLETEAVDFLQINYSAAEREAELRLLPLALDRGIAVIGNRPFAEGQLFGKLRGQPVPDWAVEIECSTWAQLLLKFVVSHPAITCVIPATSDLGHLRDNMAALNGPLPDETLRERIAAAVA
jgi:aryl-alcohol dehydrogenase-like predicted oxidoreductase